MYIAILFSILKERTIDIRYTMRVNLKNVVVSERSQIQDDVLLYESIYMKWLEKADM